MSLNEEVDRVTVLIDSPPEIMPLAPDVHKELVQVPDVSPTTLPMFELSCVLGPELPAPLPDRFIGDDNPPFRQELLHIAEAQRESMV
jgi:hypothetical protein